MHRSHRRFTRSLTIGTAAALGLSGLLFAPSAFAAAPGADAPVVGAQYAKQAQELLSGDGVQAVGRDADGNVVIVKTVGESDAVDAFTDSYANVVVREIGGPLEATATTDVVGGAGYFAPTSADAGISCSIGFTGWSPAGAPAVITAGHCTEDGLLENTYLSDPALDAAGGGVGVGAELGTFGFSQYGGAGNTVGSQGDLNSIDVAVIDVTNTDLDLLPVVTDWTTLTDLSLSTLPITAVGKPVAGAPISKSGRTTGYTSAPSVDVVDGWANVAGRIVYGFGTTGLESDEGDSGGAMFQGSTAVGILSGGRAATDTEPSFIWGSDLTNALSHTGGYTVALTIAAPALSSPANGGDVERGARISGTAPALSTITVDPATGADIVVTADAAGAFSFPAPAALGAYAFTLQAKLGFDTSATSAFAVNVVPAPLQAPVITSPVNGSSSTTDITAITGTALPGATVTLTGSVAGTDVADNTGAWSVATDLGYGVGYSVTATQAFEGQTSPVATSVFSVVPEAAVISTPANGTSFAAADAPTSVSGTGIDGATITLIHNGGAAVTTTVVDGRWSFALGASRVGGNTIVITQTIDGAATVTESGYTVAAAAVAVVPRDPALAATGIDLMPAGGLAAVLLLAGAAFLAVRRVRFGTAKN
jgi:hypothetical protein